MKIAKIGIQIFIAVLILASSVLPEAAEGRTATDGGVTEQVSVASDGTRENTLPTRQNNPQSFIQDAWNVEYVEQIGGLTDSVAIQGNYAYIGVGYCMIVLDISNPSSLLVVGKTPPLTDRISDLVISGGYAYVADRLAGLKVVDISNPANPFQVGFYATPGGAEAVAISGSYAYIADSSDGLRVVDISNPANPSEVGFYDPPYGADAVAISGSYAYVGDLVGLRVVDISNPANPFEVGFYDAPDPAYAVAISGSYAYVAATYAGLRVVDISNPANPFEVGFYDTPYTAYDVALSGSYAYVGGYDAGLSVVDISNPANPFEVGFYDTPDGVTDVAISGSYAYVASYDAGLMVVDISNPANPFEVGFYDIPYAAYDVALSGSYAYVGDYGGLGVVDISNPANPFQVGFCDTPNYAEAVAISGSYAYVADDFAGLRVVDISNPANPFEVGFYDPHIAYDVALSGSYAYVADGGGLRVVDISNPASPFEVGFYDTQYGADAVAISGSYAYVADIGGLWVVDISNPASPFEVGFYDTPDDAEAVTISGSYAYVADSSAGLRVVDISNPANPSEIGFYDSPNRAVGVTISGSYAFVGDYGGLRVVDISNPANPFEVGFYDTPDSVTDVAISGSYAYVANHGGGLLILRFTGDIPTYSISGTITNIWSMPIPDVTVSIDAEHSAVTDSEGNYTISGLITGTYTLTPNKDGYSFTPPSQVVSVPPDATGVDFIGGETLSSKEIVAFVDESCNVLDSASSNASTVSEVGDYFLDKLGEDGVKLVVDSAMNVWEVAGIDWGLVGKGLGHIATPGYKAALHASWNGWTDASSAAQHWYKPLYDSIHNDRHLLFSTTARAGLRYYSQEIGFEVAKDWLLKNLIPGAGTPFADNLGVPAAQLGGSYCQELTWAGDAMIADLPPLTPEQMAAYRADMQARSLANAQIAWQVQGQRDLLWDSYQDALEQEGQWWNFWGPLLLKYAVIGGATLAWDGPGYVVASAGTAGVSLILDAVADSRALAHDQKMLDQSLFFFDGRISGVYSQVSLNSVAAFNLIRAGDAPLITKGTLDQIALNSYGHYRLWPGLWWAEDTSEAALTITNSEAFSSTYLTSAGYNHTGFWVGSERLLPEGEALELQAGEQDMAVIPFKMEKDGLSPDDDSQVDLLVLGASETGIYPVSQVLVTWSPTRIETLTGASAQPPSGYSLEQANAAPAYAFPLTSFVSMAGNSTNPLLTLGVENPFTMTVSATVTQTIPADFTIIDAGGGQQVGDALVWTEVISPGAGVSWQAVFGWQSAPGATINLPGATLEFNDPNTGEGDTYQAEDEVVEAGWPVETSIELPDHLTNNLPGTITVTLARAPESLPLEGTFTLTLSSLDGTELFSKVIDADLDPYGVIYSEIPVQVSGQDRYVVIRGFLELNGVVKEVYLDIVPLYKIAFLPMAVK